MKLVRRLSQWTAPVVELVLPPRCWVTQGDATGLAGLSAETRQAIGKLAAQNYCGHCGLTVGPYEVHDRRDPCGRCGEREVGVAHVARVGTFSEPLVALVHRLKFARAWEVAGVLAPFLLQAMLAVSEGAGVPIDALVPVPLHWWRRAGRGFNQAEELARGVSTLMPAWRVVRGLRRVRLTDAQAQTDSRTARMENMRGAFVPLAGAGLGGKHVWLIDDVTTTGATIHAAATALRKLPKSARPASINAAVVCVTDHKSPRVTKFSRVIA